MLSILKVKCLSALICLCFYEEFQTTFNMMDVLSGDSCRYDDDEEEEEEEDVVE